MLDQNKYIKGVKRRMRFLWCAVEFLFLLLIVFGVMCWRISYITINRDITVSPKEEAINMFDNYITAESNLLILVTILITVIVIVVPLFINIFFRNTNEEWYKKKVEDAEKTMNEELEKVLCKLQNKSQSIEDYKNYTELHAKVVKKHAEEIKELKKNFSVYISNYKLEIKNKESLKKLEKIDNRKEKIEYLKSEFLKYNNQYPAIGFYELGKLYFEENDYNNAEKQLINAIDMNHDYSEAYRLKAEVLLQQARDLESCEKEKSLKESWIAIETALGFDKDNICMYDIRSQVFFEMKMYENAKIDIEKCINLAKEDERKNFIKRKKEIEKLLDNEIKNETINFNGIPFKMIEVKGGAFSMGDESNSADPDEQPLHRVLIDDFYISETVVTQELWEKVMGYNPVVSQEVSSRFVGKYLPVVNVSWNEVQNFLKIINKDSVNNRPVGTNFILPTEAQWEFAARGGNKSKQFKYSGSNDINSVAWYLMNSGDERLNRGNDDWNYDALKVLMDGNVNFLRKKGDNWIDNVVDINNCRIHQVKTKGGNELGLFDMSGNVWEWCDDKYDMYNKEPQVNHKTTEGRYCVVRGGSWYNNSATCRLSYRMRFKPNICYKNIGFRLALVYNSTDNY